MRLLCAMVASIVVVFAPHSVRLALLGLSHIHIANIPKTTAPIAPNMNNTKSGKSVHANHFFDLYSSLSSAILTNGTAKNKANTAIIKNVTHAFTIILIPRQVWLSQQICARYSRLVCAQMSALRPI